MEAMVAKGLQRSPSRFRMFAYCTDEPYEYGYKCGILGPVHSQIRNCGARSMLARILHLLFEVLWGFPLDLKNGPEEGPAFLKVSSASPCISPARRDKPWYEPLRLVCPSEMCYTNIHVFLGLQRDLRGLACRGKS
jgi:hypothetical protein